jgi:hypothetical protein
MKTTMKAPMNMMIMMIECRLDSCNLHNVVMVMIKEDHHESTKHLMNMMIMTMM